MGEITIPPIFYRDPWNLPFAERFDDFLSGAYRVAYYCEQPDRSTFRYRCFAMAEAINSHVSKASAGYFWESDGLKLIDVAKEADVLVISRARYTWELEQLITVARNWGARIFFDVDDLVVEPAMVVPLLQGIGHFSPGYGPEMEKGYDLWFSYVSRLRTTMELTDCVIATNDYLAAELNKVTDLPVKVINNFMSEEQVRYSNELVSSKSVTGDALQDLYIGYFSGTATHSGDFAIATEALATVMKERPRVRLRIVGDLDLTGTPLEAFADRMETRQAVDFLNLQRFISATEININPLQDTVFHNCKSELKYFDAAAVKVPTLASPTFAYRQAIEDGYNGRLVDDDAWYETLLDVIDNYETLGVEMGERAYSQAMQRFTGQGNANRISEALGIP